jgi:HSP20 family molecular chaperone IbpA
MAAANAPVDVKELSGAYVFVVDVPGLRNTDIKVTTSSNDSLMGRSNSRSSSNHVNRVSFKLFRKIRVRFDAAQRCSAE